MAGPLDIQRYPKGLIDLLGMRATGDTPHQLGQAILGELDLLDFYLCDRVEAQTFNAAAAVAALGPILFTGSQVPQGEAWLVYEATVFSQTLAAASSETICPFVARSQSGTFNMGLIPPMSVAASSQLLQGVHFEHPTLVMAGAQFGFQVTAFTGAPANTPQLSLYFARIRM